MSDLLVRKSAIISDCGFYRYELRREWDDDPTIIRNWRRAQALGYGSLIVWNLGAGRATDPTDWRRMADPIGPENKRHIERILTECRDRGGIAVVGWGNMGGGSLEMGALAIARRVGIVLHCLGTTASGQPKHPLYVANSQPLVSWP